jgi:hypothetical protein
MTTTKKVNNQRRSFGNQAVFVIAIVSCFFVLASAASGSSRSNYFSRAQTSANASSATAKALSPQDRKAAVRTAWDPSSREADWDEFPQMRIATDAIGSLADVILSSTPIFGPPCCIPL